MANENTNTSLNSDQSFPKKDNLPLIVLAVTGILFLICITVALVFGRPYLQSRTVIVLEPDYAKVSSIDTKTLEETARILTERCDYMGCKSVTFTVSENNQIVGKIPVYMDLDIDILVSEITTIGLLEFTNFGPTPVPEGTRVTTDFLHPFVLQADEKAWHTIMTNAEIESATVSKDQLGRYVISFTLTETGTQIFAKYTSANVGDYLGIILDKVVLSMPQVGSPITSGQGEITGNFDEESARSLAAYLNINPLPIPLVVVDIGE